MTAKIVLFGATGYTGHLVAEEMVRKGLRPVLCGRNQEKLANLSRRLGGLETALADAGDEAGLADLLDRGDILVSTVGPFARYGRTAVSAAVARGAIYIDSTGEPSFIQEIFEHYGPRAKAAGAALITACGYDYIPGNCAAGMALEAAGSQAVRVDVGYFSKEDGRIRSLEMSQGTAASLRMAMVAPIKVWRSGNLHREAGGTRMRSFRIDGAENPALTVSGTEHFSLPRVYPALQNINTYLGWFGGMTYLMKQAAMVQSLLLKVPGVRPLVGSVLARLPESKGQGPNAEKRRRQTSHIVAEAFDLTGDRIARVDLAGADGYTFTAGMIAWAADMAARGNVSGAGALGPIEAFGLEALIEGCRQSGLAMVQGED